MKDTLSGFLTLDTQDEPLIVLHKGARCYAQSLKKAFHGLIHSSQTPTIEERHTDPHLSSIARTSLLPPLQKKRLKSKIYIVDYYIEGQERLEA
ncbi:hypothetical protein KDW_51080 [Dictyobacter vulcani]|uniref:Uncharacterized protein n=1 Tax=Dictyobacter vulcani TaxID=2607529 RepID=A0A5J4L0F7_9CHLR|nr:hypothetical protein [Dictyobacter vulcani]GER90946.1 hypothetical protein KDW_51080 [Dictyobacter vulcani]